jgi:hypothetical protein
MFGRIFTKNAPAMLVGGGAAGGAALTLVRNVTQHMYGVKGTYLDIPVTRYPMPPLSADVRYLSVAFIYLTLTFSPSWYSFIT